MLCDIIIFAARLSEEGVYRSEKLDTSFIFELKFEQSDTGVLSFVYAE